MSAVDYSVYYYKGTPPSRPKRVKGSKKKPIILTVTAIVLIAVFFSVNFALDGLLFDAAKGFFSGKSHTYYYAVSIEKNSAEEAYAYALNAKQSGAAGCVYAEEDKFFVVLSLFLIKEEAEAVAKKNDASVKKTVLWEDEEYDTVTASVSTLLSTAESLEAGKIFEIKVLEAYSEIKANALTQKQLAMEENTPLHRINMFIGGLNEETVVEGTKHEILSEMRYVACMAVLPYD